MLFCRRGVRKLRFMSDTASRAPSSASPTIGFAAGVGAFLIWGLFPLYLKPLADVSAQQIIAHRMVWCCVFVFLYLGWRGALREVLTALRSPPVVGRLVSAQC
jgi:chloramphenicol-sensitive protein RarD